MSSLGNTDFRKRLKEFRIHFGLTQLQIATIIKWKQSDYAQLELGIRNIDLDIINLIAAIYGLVGWEFIKKDTAIPDISQLPEKTKKLIEQNKKTGKQPRIQKFKATYEVTKILTSGKLPQEFSSVNIYENLDSKKRTLTTPKEISATLRQKSIKNLIIDLNKKKGREKLYSLK